MTAPEALFSGPLGSRGPWPQPGSRAQGLHLPLGCGPSPALLPCLPPQGTPAGSQPLLPRDSALRTLSQAWGGWWGGSPTPRNLVWGRRPGRGAGPETPICEAGESRARRPSGERRRAQWGRRLRQGVQARAAGSMGSVSWGWGTVRAPGHQATGPEVAGRMCRAAEGRGRSMGWASQVGRGGGGVSGSRGRGGAAPGHCGHLCGDARRPAPRAAALFWSQAHGQKNGPPGSRGSTAAAPPGPRGDRGLCHSARVSGPGHPG